MNALPVVSFEVVDAMIADIRRNKSTGDCVERFNELSESQPNLMLLVETYEKLGMLIGGVKGVALIKSLSMNLCRAINNQLEVNELENLNV